MLQSYLDSMYPYDASEPSSRRESPSTSGSNTPMTLARGPFDKVSLPSIGSMFASAPSDDIYEARRSSSLPYPNTRPVPASASQWFGLTAHDDRTRSAASNASSGSPDSPTSPSFGSYSSTSTAPTTVKSSPGASPFSDRLSLPAAPSTTGREYPVTIPVPPSDATPGALGSTDSASPTPAGDSPPATTSTAQPQRRRGKLPKHVTETLRTWLLSHADHPYPTEEEKKMLCNVTGLTLSQVSNWMINARRRILVPASKQQAALNATSGPYMGIPRSSAATDLARANRVGISIPHSLPPTIDPYSNTSAYSLPALSQAGDLHMAPRGYPSLATGRTSYGFPGPALHQNYYGGGLPAAPLPNYGAGLVPSGPGRYYGDHDSPFASTH
ncbi:homeobox KN domain protein [Ceratobasidium sp. AG-Ba]|nr:homeobox KN domain protein [Ceratobasidium sp. AG-Ba]